MGCIISLAFVLRWNVAIGINDLLFIIFTSIITDTLGLAFTNMPSMVLFAKITPKRIEATVFALLTGVHNLAGGFLAPMIGAGINKAFVGVTADNLDNFYICVIIQLITVLIPLLFVTMIPSRSDIKEL